MEKIEKPWVAFSNSAGRYGLIVGESPDKILIKYFESQIEPEEEYSLEFTERFKTFEDLADYLSNRLEKFSYQIVEELRIKFPSQFKNIDKVGRDLTKPYPRLDIGDWEDMQVEGEVAGFGVIKDIDEAKKEMGKLGGYICKMSMEIFRLRLTYGEEVWQSVYHSKEEDDLIRKTHEAEKYKYQIKG